MNNSNHLMFVKPDIDFQFSLIEKELKGKILKETIKYGENIAIKPIYTESNKKVSTPPSSLSYKINFEEIKYTDINNSGLLSLLDNGVNGLVINFKSNQVKLEDFKSKFLNVNFNYIHTFLKNIDNTSIEIIYKHIADTYDEYDNSLICSSNNENTQYGKQLRLREDDFFNNCRDIFYEIINCKNDCIYIFVELSNDFYWDVSKIRAFKILLSNYIYKEKLNKKILIIGTSKISHKDEIEVPERNILKLTLGSIVALISGIDGICNQSFTSAGDSHSTRVSRNIFNILNEESFFNIVNNPIDGSYYIDNYTENVAKIIYSYLKLK